MTDTAVIFTKFTVAQYHYMQMSVSNLTQSRNMGSTITNVFTLLDQV